MQGCFPASWQPDPERDATVSRGGPAARTVPAMRSLLAHRVWTRRDPILCPAMMKRGRSVLHPHGATGCVSVPRVRPSSGAAAAPRSAAGGHGDASTPSKGTAALHGAPQGRGCSGMIADHAPLGIPSLKLTGTATSVPMECLPWMPRSWCPRTSTDDGRQGTAAVPSRPLSPCLGTYLMVFFSLRPRLESGVPTVSRDVLYRFPCGDSRGVRARCCPQDGGGNFRLNRPWVN